MPFTSNSRSAVLVVGLLVAGCLLPVVPAGTALEGRRAPVPREEADAPWPAFHGNAERDGNSGGSGPGTSNLLWSNNTGANCYGSPVVAGDRVFIGSTAGTMYCFNATTGWRLWTFGTGGRIHSTPWVDIDSDRLYFGSHDQYVYCLNATSGSQLWRTLLGGVVTSSPLLEDGMVYVGCGDWYYGSPDGYLYCLHASNGTRAWRTANAGGASSPAASDGRLFSIGDDGLVCLDPATGSKLWSNTSGSAGFGSASVANGRVYVATMSGHVICFNASGGTGLWDTTTGYTESSSTPAVSNGSVYVCVDNGGSGALVKLDALTGNTAWSYAVGGAPWGSPAVAGDRVYFANDRTIECVNASDHSQLWSHLGAAGDMYGIGGSPALAGGRLYIGGAEAKVYCIGQGEPNRPPAAVMLEPPSEIQETSMVLRWSGSADADFARYELHRSLLPGFIPGLSTLVQPGGNITDVNRLSLNVSGLNYSTRYYFRLRVWDSGVPPMFNDSNEVFGTTLTPNGAPFSVKLFPAEDITPYAMRLSWSASNDSDFDRYEVHRSLLQSFVPIPSTLVATIDDVNENSTVVTGLRPWTTYYFKVRVYDNGSPVLYSDSNTLGALTGNTAPFAVTLDEPQMGATSADLSWSPGADDDFAAYEVHFSQEEGFSPGNATRAIVIENRLTTDHSITGLQLARTYHFLVRVTDQGGMFNDSNVVTGLSANTLPKAVISSPEDGDVFDTRTPAGFDGSASSDQDLDALSFFWVSSVDGYLSSNATFTTLLSEGGHRISLYVNDGHGHNVSARVTITVNKAPNRRPAVAVTAPADNSKVSGVVTFTGAASDIDGNDTLRTVELKLGKADWEEADGVGDWTFEWNTTKVANGKYKVLFRSYDGDLYSTEASLSLTVENVFVNARPDVAINPPLSGRFSKTTVVTGTASDADGTVAYVELSLDGGAWQRAFGTRDWSYSLDTTQLGNGMHSLQARAYDGMDYSDAEWLNFTVSNAAPAASSGPNALLLGGVVALVLVAVVVGLLLMRRKKGPEPEARFVSGQEAAAQQGFLQTGEQQAPAAVPAYSAFHRQPGAGDGPNAPPEARPVDDQYPENGS